MIRVLHVIGSLNIGGSQSLIMNIYRNIDRNKIQFDFVINQEKHRFLEKEIFKMGGRVFFIPQINKKNPKKFLHDWDSFLKSHEEFLIVHGHVRSTAAIYLRVARKNGRFAIAHSHNTSSGSGIHAIIKNILQFPIRYNADYFMACSNEAGSWLFGNKITHQKNYHILTNAIELDKFHRDEYTRNTIREKYDFNNSIVIGNVGRFTKQKNQLFLLDIFKKFHDNYKNSILLLIGYGEMKDAIIQKIKEFKLEENVIIPEDNDRPEKYLQAMDIYVFPSLYEGLGISLVEAQAAGLPCVISTTIPKRAIISDKVTILDLYKNSKEDWVKAICYFKENGLENKCHEELKMYDINNIVKWIENFYIENGEY